MKFRSTIFLFLLPLICCQNQLFGQDNLFGIWVGSGERKLIEFNPNTGANLVISPSSIFSSYFIDGGVTMDTNTNRYFIKVRNNGEDWIYGINLTTGMPDVSFLLGNVGDIHQMRFNPVDGFIYGIKVESNSRFLVKMDLITGTITTISPNSIFSSYFFDSGATIDTNSNRYFIKVRNNGEDWLYGINLTTGTPDVSILLSNPQDIHQIHYNPIDGFIYGIKVESSSRFLVRMDLSTGTITTISPSSIFSSYHFNSGATIDINTNRYFIKVRNNGENWIYGINLTTGIPDINLLLPNPEVIHQMIAHPITNDPTLPINLSDLWLTAGDDFITCHWETITEVNSDNFIVEKSIDGVNWEFVAKVKGAGNSSLPITYTSIDVTPYKKGTSYYRLKQNDFDGCWSFSEVKSIIIEKQKTNDLLIYPNPIRNSFTIESNGDCLEDIKVYNYLGQDVSTGLKILSQNSTRIVCRFPDLIKGRYIVTACNNSKVIIKY